MTTESRIQIDKLDNQNRGIWRRKFKALLLSKRLGGVIDGTDEDKDNSKSQFLGLIQLHLSDAYLSMADDVAAAKALWDKRLRRPSLRRTTPDAFCSDRS